ncbi:MAG: glycerate kinase [Anaerolineales bacterium]
MNLKNKAAPNPTAQRILESVLAAADPAALLKDSLQRDGNRLLVGHYELSLPRDGRIYLIAIGKAASRLAETTVDILGASPHAGLLTLLAEHECDPPAPIRVFQAGHPLPDQGSLAAGAYAADMLADATPEDRLIVLISGGGSAMFELLPEEIRLDHVRTLTEDMLQAGMPIQEMNRVRQALSLVKGGGLAEMAAPAMTIAMILSDVVGNPLEDVASGPTIPTQTGPETARSVLERYDLWHGLPEPVKNRLKDQQPRSPMIFQPVNVLLGGNEIALAAANDALGSLGYQLEIVTAAMQGEARQAGRAFAERLAETEAGRALLQGGETTVTVTGSGRGGRNQEFALAAALELEGGPARTIMALATDGIDGGTEAAGAVVDHRTAAEIRANNLDPEALLANNDSHRALASVDALIHTGPTGTNLCDLVVGWHDQESEAPPSR